MSYKFSKSSLAKLQTCHPDIQKVMFEVIKHVDVTIIEGIRTLETQEEYVRTGKSKTLNSKHLMQPDGYSHAIDVIGYPINWNDSARNYHIGGVIRGIALALGVKLRWGGDWNSDFQVKDQSFIDLPHFELAGKK